MLFEGNTTGELSTLQFAKTVATELLRDSLAITIKKDKKKNYSGGFALTDGYVFTDQVSALLRFLPYNSLTIITKCVEGTMLIEHFYLRLRCNPIDRICAIGSLYN